MMSVSLMVYGVESVVPFNVIGYFEEIITSVTMPKSVELL